LHVTSSSRSLLHAPSTARTRLGIHLGLLEEDLRQARRVRELPNDLARAILANLRHAANLEEEIEGAVALQCDVIVG
jgi:antitoxin PrlF